MAKSDRNVLLYIIAVWWICQWCGTLANEFHIGSEPESGKCLHTWLIYFDIPKIVT